MYNEHRIDALIRLELQAIADRAAHSDWRRSPRAPSPVRRRDRRASTAGRRRWRRNPR
jgi:hypothetical protein